ncbi:MAG: hypothetical protein IJU44_01370 [Kiritimatiellae bacterium]|nr:hypothetical protein [Kiritimatiellia bacterium]
MLLRGNFKTSPRTPVLGNAANFIKTAPRRQAFSWETGGANSFTEHWLTIQPYLFDFLEDEVGELDENQRLFVRMAESVELGRIATKYG